MKDAISSPYGPRISLPPTYRRWKVHRLHPACFPTGKLLPGLRTPYRARLPRRHSPRRRTQPTRHWRDRATVPSRGSRVVTIGELRFTDDGLGSALPSTGVVNCYRWMGKPRTDPFPSQKVWGFRRLTASSAAFLRTSPGPSIANPLPTDKMENETQQLDNPSPTAIYSLLPSIEPEAEASAEAPVSAPIPLSPTPMMPPSHNPHPRTLRGIWGSALSSAPSPLGKDISKMHCILDMSIKQGGWVGLHLVPGWGKEGSLLPGTKQRGAPAPGRRCSPLFFTPLSLNNQTRA